MKKVAILLAMVAASFARCQKPALDEPVEVNDTFTASIEEYGSQTKTSMNTEKQTLWSVGDRVAIFRGKTTACEYKLTDESADSQSGTFKWVSGDKTTGADVPCNVAYYPYADGLALSADLEISNVVLPEVQAYAENSFANGAFPMVAVTATVDNRALVFKNVAGAMNLQFKGTQKVLSVKVEGNAGEVLSGAAVVAAGSTPSVQMVSSEPTAVVLDCGEGVQLSETEATSFILALPPVQFTEGFTVTVLDANDLLYTIENSASNEILRSGILVMPELTLNESEGVQQGPKWGIAGAVTSWADNADIAMSKTETEGLFVAKNVTMPDGDFKIRANGEWNDNYNYGLAENGVVAAGYYYELILGSASQNITLASGTYDIWFNLTQNTVTIMNAGEDPSTATKGTPVKPLVDTWYLVGEFNGWAAADQNYLMASEDGWYVFKGFVANGGDVKFVADASWTVNRGGDFSSANTEISLYPNGSNMSVTAGTYDVYLNADATAAYFMTPGYTPGQTPEPDPTPDPEPEQPAEPEVDNNLYLKPNSNWTQANARFAAYFFGNGEKWVSMTDSDKDGIYEVEKQAGYPNVIFCRMNPSSSANNWNNKWNQTGDLKIPTDGKNLFTLPNGAWDGSTSSWSVMSK